MWHGSEHEPVKVWHRESRIAVDRRVEQPHVDEFGAGGGQLGGLAAHDSGDIRGLLGIGTKLRHGAHVGDLKLGTVEPDPEKGPSI